jgi:hypothetical protein
MAEADVKRKKRSGDEPEEAAAPEASAAARGSGRRSALRDSLRLPEMVPMPEAFRQSLNREPGARYLEPGLYDGFGRKLGTLRETHPDARIVIQFAGVTFVWGVFSRRLAPGQEGWLTFENVPGVMPITPFFNEWDRKRSEPKLGDALLPLLSSERGRGVARVAGRNESDGDVLAAAGLIVSQDLELPPRGGGGGR